MISLRDSCIEFFQKEDTQRHIKDIIRPIVNIIYNEIYTYIFFICIYSVFLMFMTLAILIFLIWIRNTLRLLTIKVDAVSSNTDIIKLLRELEKLPEVHRQAASFSPLNDFLRFI
jgi:hypothetical protein